MITSGDLVQLQSNDNLSSLFRADGPVALRGHRVDLREVEAVVSTHPAVQRCLVVVAPSSPSGPAAPLVAYVTTRTTPAPTAAELRSHVQGLLPDALVPAAFVFLEEFPLDPSGQIDHCALPLPEAGESAHLAAAAFPQTELERTIIAVWQAVLHSNKIGVDDNFYDIGGNSLLLAQAQAQLERALGRHVPILAMLKYPTVSSLARSLASGDDNARTSGVPSRADHQQQLLRQQQYHLRQLAQQRPVSGSRN